MGEIKDEIKSIIIKSGWSLTELVSALSEAYGWSNSVSNLSNKLTKGTLRYSEAVQIATVIGYYIEWIPMPNEIVTPDIEQINRIIRGAQTSRRPLGGKLAPRSTGRLPYGVDESLDGVILTKELDNIELQQPPGRMIRDNKSEPSDE